MYKKKEIVIESTCDRCVMDTTASNFKKNSFGCNYCENFLDKLKEFDTKRDEYQIDNLMKIIQSKGKHKKYDCIIGLSGGVDSSWALLKAVELGLKPLAVHMDNGWNTELAQQNIHNIVDKLDVDLFTHVIDWEEYKALQKTFFKANVIDIELLYDNALAKVNYKKADEYGINYILSGSNISTEGMEMPENWAWKNKHDLLNIKDIFKKFDGRSFPKTFPGFGFFDSLLYRAKGIRWVPFLNYLDYKKEEALNELEKKLITKDIHTNIMKMFLLDSYQGYILPKKFNVDKRKVHLSTLIITDQINRETALDSLSGDPYPDLLLLQEDLEYFLKKFNWTHKQLNEYILDSSNVVEHDSFKTNSHYLDGLNFLIQKLKQWIS